MQCTVPVHVARARCRAAAVLLYSTKKNIIPGYYTIPYRYFELVKCMIKKSQK